MKRLWLVGLAFLLVTNTAEPDTLAQLRSRVNKYFQDSSNVVYDTTLKNEVINNALEEYTRSFAVDVDTFRQAVDSGVRMYALPDSAGELVVSVHKDDDVFSEIKQIPSDSVPAMEDGVLQFFSVSGRYLVLYPRPIMPDTVIYFYNRISPIMDSSSVECELQNSLEEPIVLLAASKLWQMGDLRLDLASYYYQLYEHTAARLTHTYVEKPREP